METVVKTVMALTYLMERSAVHIKRFLFNYSINHQNNRMLQPSKCLQLTLSQTCICITHVIGEVVCSDIRLNMWASSTRLVSQNQFSHKYFPKHQIFALKGSNSELWSYRLLPVMEDPCSTGKKGHFNSYLYILKRTDPKFQSLWSFKWKIQSKKNKLFLVEQVLKRSGEHAVQTWTDLCEAQQKGQHIGNHQTAAHTHM